MRGTKCDSAADEREAGVVDRPREWAFSILPIPWQIGGSEEAFRRARFADRDWTQLHSRLS